MEGELWTESWLCKRAMGCKEGLSDCTKGDKGGPCLGKSGVKPRCKQKAVLAKKADKK